VKKFNLSNFIRGWFVGGFEPTLYSTQNVEVAVQHFEKGSKELSHCHKVATEITVIVSGRVRMNDNIFETGDILKIDPGEYTDFEAMEETVTTVVKIPGALNDKYIESEQN